MLNKFFRVFIRLFFHITRFLLRPLEAVAPRIYMPLYLFLLKLYGLQLNGIPRYISTKVRFDDFSRITLGDRVVVSENVTFLTHDYSLTTGLIAIGSCPSSDQSFLSPITIGDNVFIGLGSIILPGTVINKNVIIGAGSVIRGEIPSNSVVLGNPGIVVGTLTDKAIKWQKHIFESHVHTD